MDGIYYDAKRGRLIEKKGRGVSIYWNKSMTDYLRNNYARSYNEELAGCLGVSESTLHRKARELGLRKDKEWLTAVHDERRKWAHMAGRLKGYPGSFKKGCHASPATEFKKGRKETADQKERRIRKYKKWCISNPDKMKAKVQKQRETIMAKKQLSLQDPV